MLGGYIDLLSTHRAWVVFTVYPNKPTDTFIFILFCFYLHLLYFPTREIYWTLRFLSYNLQYCIYDNTACSQVILPCSANIDNLNHFSALLVGSDIDIVSPLKSTSIKKFLPIETWVLCCKVVS